MIGPDMPDHTSIFETMPELSTTYMKPSSTRGVASRLSSFELPPSATAKRSFKFLMLDLSMVPSGEKRCPPKS